MTLEIVEENTECSECSRDILTSDLVECSDCQKSICSKCSKEDDDNNQICEDCYIENYGKCEACNTTHKTDDLLFFNDSLYCEDCYHEYVGTCEDCSEQFDIDSLTRVSNDSLVCRSCLSNNYFECSGCNEYFSYDDACECRGCSERLCDSCLDEHESNCSDVEEEIELYSHGENLKNNGEDAISDYHPEIEWEKKTHKIDSKYAHFFGVELEIETGENTDSVAKQVGKHLAGNVLCSHDGSLTKGFEIIFTPHKREAFRRLELTKKLADFSALGARSHDTSTCGLHVHIERKDWFYLSSPIKPSLNNADLYQKFYLVLKDEILKFCRRSERALEIYCTFRESRFERMSMVNLTNNKTIEVRIWKGTLSPERFRASILFSLAVVDFMKTHSKIAIHRNDAETLLNQFHTWLAKENEYQSLVKFFKTKKLFNF